MFINRRVWRDAMAGSAVTLASVAMAATSTLTPAGAMPLGANQVSALDQPAQAAFGGGTPMCLVQGALMYPLFIGVVMFMNPASIPSALPAYWVGGKDWAGRDMPGRLSGCGLQLG
jgi:hypothetical protein